MEATNEQAVGTLEGAKGVKEGANRNKKPAQNERKRVRTSKTKMGCRTCKVRRVKCDETRPACLRCLKIGGNYCRGYEHTVIPRKVAERRVLLPLATAEVSLQKVGNQGELDSFRLYCEKVAPRLSFAHDGIWQRLLLQAGQENDFIRNAIFAIGGFRRRSHTSRGSGEGYTGIDFEKLDKDALAQYGKFLEGTKRYIASTTREEGRRLAMIACLLIICIENMQYRPHNALVHTQQGLKLVEEMSHEDTDTAGSSSRNSDTIEEELVQQFSRLDLQVVGCYDVQPKNIHRKLKGEGATMIRDMPNVFPSIEDASRYLELVMRRAFHFMAYTAQEHKAQFKFGLEDGSCALLCAREERETNAPPCVIHFEHERYESEVRRWNRAFEPLFSDVMWNSSHPDAARALMMKVHSITASLSLADHLATSELHWDGLMTEMESLIYYSKKLLEHPHYVKGQFAFDMGLIYPLILASLNCRDRKLRREAIDLLSEDPWREAHWDSAHAADVAKFIMTVEEENVETEFIPEYARVRAFEVDISMKTGKVHMTCLRGIGDAAVTVEGFLDWSCR